jgi:hypothetical protein
MGEWINLDHVEPLTGVCEHGNKLPDSVKCGEFLD